MDQAMESEPIGMNAQERKLTVDALLTYGISLAGLIQSERFSATSPERAQLMQVLLRTTALLKRLGGAVPAEMTVEPPAATTERSPLH
jgi:hypothetical protein